jgi:hypothetical protein
VSVGDCFEADRLSFGDVVEIDEGHLVLRGGGDFTSGAPADSEPDEATRARATELATKYGMVVTGCHGEWWGYSEYTPDPGDVSVFTWSRTC